MDDLDKDAWQVIVEQLVRMQIEALRAGVETADARDRSGSLGLTSARVSPLAVAAASSVPRAGPDAFA